MTPIEPYINAIIGMIGIAYPFLLQVTTNFDTKYSNENITELFEEEWVSPAFKYSLFSSLFFVVIWSLKLEPLRCIKSKYDWFNFVINNSADLLLAINSIILIIIFFYYVKKVFVYVSASRLIPFLISKYENIETDDKYFDVLKDLFLHYLRTQQTRFTNSLSEFFYFEFQKIRKKELGKPVKYPTEYYILIYRTIEELAIVKDKRNINLEYRTAGSMWLLGETYSNEISDITFTWIWNNLLLAIRYNQDDLILHHWETCHQYFRLNLNYLHPSYVSSVASDEFTQILETGKRKNERKKFKEFHIALGALLLYKNRNSTLKEIFEYTQSEPPSYELFPESIFELLSFYVKFSDPYDREYYKFYINYSFPNARGMNGEKIVKQWICKYLGILFLRFFAINNIQNVTNSILGIKKPETKEIKVWISRLKELQNYLEALFFEKNYLESLNIEYLTPGFFVERSSLDPIDFLKGYISILEADYKFNSENAKIDKNKVLKFENETNSLITKKLTELKQVNINDDLLDLDLDKWYVEGIKTVVERDFLAIDSEVEYLNLNSILANITIENLTQTFANTFQFKTNISYLIKPDELDLAIRKLNLNETYIIVNFGVDLSGFNGISNLSILSFENKGVGNQVIYILKKTDLPTINTLPVEQEIIKKYKLNPINKVLNLYTTHICFSNIDKKDDIYTENLGKRSEDEMNKSLLLGVFLKTEILWRQNANVLQIKCYSIFSNTELPNTIDDIRPLI